MNIPEKRIVDFINAHHVLTLATCSENNPWCANCFYTYLPDENCFVFTSDDDTKHVKDVGENLKVAGSVVLETKIIGKIQGIQFRGVMEKPAQNQMIKAKKAYLKKFPYAALMKTSLWVLKLNYIKMTDNRLGFGKKLIWENDC
ncbi:MAG: pyridoxamine 5'-phosphate oxidase family protein [Prolixibacteraceae bacterium]|nr:pyridoxamine 5'-phosphate oxidase family protein [Prolixibacteraceae bacterium]